MLLNYCKVILYKFIYEIPLFENKNIKIDKYHSFFSDLLTRKKIILIGRGQSGVDFDFKSIKNINDYFIIVLNNVALEKLNFDGQIKLDVQMGMPGGPPFTIYKKKILRKFHIKKIYSNKVKAEPGFLRFVNNYSNRKINIYSYPSEEEFNKYTYNETGVGIPFTQTGSIIRVLLRSTELEEIIFVGIDFFYTNYLLNSFHFSGAGVKEIPKGNFKNKGLPLISFIIDNFKNINNTREVKLIFNKKIKHLIGNHDFVNYY